jgi:hypothetical protein
MVYRVYCILGFGWLSFFYNETFTTLKSYSYLIKYAWKGECSSRPTTMEQLLPLKSIIFQNLTPL